MSYFEMVDVRKTFKKKAALDGVSLSVTQPSIIGLVGKNGSGKTTLLRHIVGLYLPTSGTCTTLDCETPLLDAPQLSRIGFAQQHDTLIGWMKAARFIRYISRFYDMWDEDLERHLVETFEIDLKARVGTMSPGNRQKLSLLVAVCHRPTLLLLDEPLSDLDPVVRRDVMEALLEQFRRDEMVMVVSSHLLHDLERIADRVVCMDEGKIVADSSLDELKEQYGANLDQLFRQLVGADA